MRPLLVVAGAGSGKTETMASRVVWLVANGHVEPDQVLGLTFTRKAAAQLAQRIRKRLRMVGAIGVPALAGQGDHDAAGGNERDHVAHTGHQPLADVRAGGCLLLDLRGHGASARGRGAGPCGGGVGGLRLGGGYGSTGTGLIEIYELP